MTSTERLIENARRYEASYAGKGMTPRPATGVAVVACMDARLDIHNLFGLRLGDAHVIRNAGGVITDDALRSLAISQRFLGTTEVVLVHHSNCGLENLDDDELAAAIESETGSRPPWRAGGFTDAASDVRLSAERIRASDYVPHRDLVRGFVFDVETGRLGEVDLPAAGG